MDIIDKVLLEWSYRTRKGYPDINSQEDMDLFESMFGFDPTVTEIVKLEYEVLSPKAKAIAEKIMADFKVEKEQIKPGSSTHIVIYTTDRPSLLYNFEESGQYGPNLLNKKGKFKLNGVTITLKPTGAKAGEFFNLKPQQLGITLDEKISLETLERELIEGINANKQLTPIQQQALVYTITGKSIIPDEFISELPNGFFNEVRKNFGEPHGALLYGKAVNADSVFFPSKGNYRLLDYILYKGDDQIQVSAKAAGISGNTVKYEDVLKLVDKQKGDVPKDIRTYEQIISNSSVYEGAFNAIERYGDNNLKIRVKEYKEKYPHFPKLGKKPEDEQSHFDRIVIEKDFVKYINASKPELSFEKIFNQYVAVKYVKYNINRSSLVASYNVISSGSFKIKHKSKNSTNHDSDKLGLDVKEA